MKRIVSMLFLVLFSLIVLGVGSAWAQTNSASERAKLKFGPSSPLKAPPIGLPRITGPSSVDVYVVEDFEGGVFPPTGWTRINPDTSYTWEDTSASSYGVGVSSAFINNYNYSTAPALDSLISPTITGVLATDSIKFDYAYTDYSPSFSDDSLFVDISTDNGATWTSLWREGGAGLRTRPSITTFFIPTPSEWATKSLPVPAGVVGANVKVAFTSRSNFGNNLFIDQVRVGNPPPVPLTGGSTYPINGVQNPPTSFGSMRSAAAYLNVTGVTGTGDVVLELTTGYAGETDTVGIRAIPGASSTLRVVFRPAAGYTAVTSVVGLASPNQHAIRLAGASWVTLDGRSGGVGNGRDWTVTCLGANGQMAIRLDNTTGSMTGITIRNIVMQAQAPNTTGAIFQITGNTTNTMSAVTIESNLIRSNPDSTGVRGYGITVAVASNTGNTGLVVRNNVINRFYARGINFTGGFPGALVYGNVIHHTAPVTQPTTTEFSGIYFSTTTSPGTEIHSNLVYDIQLANGLTAVNGIYDFNGNTTGASVKIYNNRVAIGSGIVPTTIPIYGIRENAVSGSLIDISFNSVYVGGTATAGTANSAAFRKDASNFVNLKNNVFYNARTNTGATGVHWGISTNNITYASIGSNDYFADGTGGVLGTTTNSAAGNQLTITAWRTAVPADLGSVSQTPNYVNAGSSPPDLHINPAIPTQLESGGVAVAGITSDFDGDTRNATTPDIGSDEFAGTGLDLSPPAISYFLLGNSGVAATRTLATTITDLSGVQLASAGAPRIYYKKGVGGPYFAAQATTIVGADFTFTIDYTNVGGIVVGDTIYYYVGAQDSLNNAGTNPAGGSGIDPPGNVPPVNPNLYRIVTVISSFPYVEDFEGGPGGWTSAIFSGSVNDWTLGTPAKVQIIGAHSGVNAWVTDLDSNYRHNQNAYVLSPLLDMSSFTQDPSLSFWHNFNMELNWEGAVVEMSTDGGSTFSRVGVLNDPLGFNWYNNSSTSGPVIPPKWSGNSSVFGTGYVSSKIRLTGAGGHALVYIRFRFGSDGSVSTPDGWAFDDVRIAASPAVDYSMNSLTQLNGIPNPFRPVERTIQEDVKGDPVTLANPNSPGALPSSNVNRSVLIDNSPTRFAHSLEAYTPDGRVFIIGGGVDGALANNPITMTSTVSSFGLTAPPYSIQWSVGGVAGTPVPRPGFPAGTLDTVSLTTTPLVRGTLTTIARAVASGDSDTTNDSRQYMHTLVYPDLAVRVKYDNGPNTPNTYIGFNNGINAVTAGVRFTAPADMKIANVDAFYRNEGNADSIEVRVWAAGVDTTAPGAMLYSKKVGGGNYLQPGAVGDYFTVPLGDDAPAFAAGSDFWLSVTFSPLIPFPMGAHNSPLTTPGHSYVSGDGGISWAPLVITTERAWLLRAVGVTPPVHDIGVSAVERIASPPDTVYFRALVTNYGDLDEAAYDVAWSIDGVTQATVSNTATLEIGDVDTLLFQWNTATLGSHTAMAWTVLGTDANPANDSASTTFTVSIPLPTEQRKDHVTSAFRATVTNEGTIGSLNAFVGTGPGSGFRFNPVTTAGQRLFGDGIMVALDSTRVSDGARTNASNGAYDADFKFLTALDSVTTGNRTTMTTSFTDSLAETPFGARVNQRTVSWDSAGIDNFLIFELDIVNTSATPWTTLHAGGLLDWDVDPATANDRGAVVVDSTNTIPGVNGGNPFAFDMLEMHQGASPNSWMGVVPLHENRFRGRRVAISTSEIYPTAHVTNGDKWRYMTGNRATNPNGDAGSAVDHAQVFGSGPYSVAVGATKRIGFAMFGGTSLANAVAAARAAQRAWVQRLGNTIDVTLVGVKDETAGLPEVFDLAQNYPNPFNPVTTIQYALPTESFVTLKVYNVLGQEIATLIDGGQQSGYFTLEWNGRNQSGSPVASGVYFYRIEARSVDGTGTFSSIKKMLMLK